MLDASTTAFHLLPYLTEFKNILVITNGAKTALESASICDKSKIGKIYLNTLCTVDDITGVISNDK